MKCTERRENERDRKSEERVKEIEEKVKEIELQRRINRLSETERGRRKER